MKLFKYITLVAVLSLVPFAQSEEKPGIPEELRESMSLSIGNLVCGMYGEFTSEPDAPHFYKKHLKMAKKMAIQIYSHKSITVKTSTSASEYYDDLRSVLLKQYKKKGPLAFKSNLKDFMANEGYNKPIWVKTCDDIYNYSQSTMETNIGSN